ncbi:MAG: phospho-N-acetylmuramoyl-pentapeptide-transferase [Ruminococcaceae bacterium]|nr:phospho-N-acetylmuramoyl-pentapeptide-transferase [Oscillospiraceae bacterium]
MELWLALLLSVLVGFGVSFGLGFGVIPWLHKLKFGQTILDIGPSWHKKKQGTPTMGGILIIAGFILSVIVVLVTDKLLSGDILLHENNRFQNVVYVKIFSGILMAVAFAFIGFIDDYIKVVKKRNLGLTEIQKSVLQCLVIAVYLFTLYKCGVNYTFIPYLGNFENALLFWVLGFIAIYGTVNAANFTDGIDGLCTSVSAVMCIGFAVCSVILQFSGMTIICAAMFGALMGFLVWNWNPSRVIMGDMGSFFIGGMICSFAYSLDAPWLIVMIGIIYVIEFGSDLVQIAYVKTHNGKRLFKMAPIHHHYEMSGWSEKKICKVFVLVTVVGVAAAVALTWFGRPQ